ncbi:MAG: hypothetical protein KDK90_25735 [Leptospiraceae bacterium]|nr:hypothetical protein [Leptospiraceae bacterium]
MTKNKKRIFSLIGIIILSFSISCNYVDKLLGKDDNDDDKKKLLLAGLLILSNTSSSTSGLTITIPDGVPLTSNVGYSDENIFIRFLKSIGVVSTAKATENAWAFVRQSALWANNNTTIIESIITPIKNYGLLNKSTTTQGTTQISGTDFIYRITPNANTTTTSTAYDGSKTFKHKFELWRSSDSAKAMEMFFDSVDSLTDQGILLLYNLNVINSSSFPDTMVCETYVATVSGSQKQTISWSGTQSFYTGSDRGRVVLELMDSNTILCFKSVVRFKGGTISGTNNVCNQSGSSQYYALAYVQNFTTTNKEATAKLSLSEGSIDNSGKVCGYSLYNYGLFKTSGFISDGNASSSVTSEYPATSRLDTLFSEINTTGSGTWDDLSQTKVDAISIAFVDTSAP